MVQFLEKAQAFPVSKAAILAAFADLQEKPSMRDAYERHSGAPLRWVKQFLGEGQDQPEIDVVDAAFSGAFIGPRLIQLGSHIVSQLDSKPSDATARHEVQAVALHELVHWGAWQAGNTAPDSADADAGFAFEGEAFAGVPAAIARLARLAPFLPAAAKALAAAGGGIAPPPPVVPPATAEPARFLDAPFARLSTRDALWPVRTTHPRRAEIAHRAADGTLHGEMSRTFGAARSGGRRHHVGIDLFCHLGDPVVAVAEGVVANVFQFTGRPGDGLLPTDCLLLQTDEGLVVNYGEIESRSAAARAATIGRRVRRGEELGRIGLVTSTKAMLHFETYARGSTVTARWMDGTPRPEPLLDPTLFLLALRQVSPPVDP